MAAQQPAASSQQVLLQVQCGAGERGEEAGDKERPGRDWPAHVIMGQPVLSLVLVHQHWPAAAAAAAGHQSLL